MKKVGGRLYFCPPDADGTFGAAIGNYGTEFNKLLIPAPCGRDKDMTMLIR
ncbi:MAG: hypothetical protein EDM05_67490 [Leptolyngbya sp. IPPAS B-1204]|nr:hypothetical protein [Elainella sp. C42_A2020_010]